MANQRRSVVPGRREVNAARVMQSGVGLDKKRIGEMLIEAGLITPAQLVDALRIQQHRGAKVVESLIYLGHLEVEDFVNFLSSQPGVASIDLAHYYIPREIIDLIPQELAVKHEIFPIDRLGHLLTLGMACPLDVATIASIEESTGLKVKALLCPRDDIQRAIDRYYKTSVADLLGIQTSQPREMNVYVAKAPEKNGSVVHKVETGLKLGRVSRLIRELESLPALPATVERVREATTDLTISANDVAQTIIKDPPIAAKVLSVANSAAYGFSNKVASVELAVALLGLRETYSIVLSAAVLNLFEKTKIFDYKIYWEEAMACAAASKIVARACKGDRDTSIFTAGLLHDIGRIALLETVPEAYAKVSPKLTGDRLIKAEEKHVGLTHTEAGYELASRWSLPDEIAIPIRFHHEPELADTLSESVAIVAIAEHWTRLTVKKRPPKKVMLRETASLLEILGLDRQAASNVYEDVAALELVHFEWTRDA